MSARDSSAGSRVLVLDGGTGSELRRRGFVLSAACWSADACLHGAELLTEIHRDYLRAGADIVTANTFAATRFVLARAGLGSRARAVVDSALDAARRARAAAGRDALLAASISCMPPGFDVRAYPDPDTEYRAYAELADQLAAARVDLVLLEMMQDTVHAARACRAARAAGLPFWIGLSCRRDPATRRLVAFDDSRVAIEAVVDALLPFDPAGVAVMHSPVDAIVPALALLERRWGGPLGAYAETPYPEDPEQSVAEPAAGPGAYAAAAREWLAAGVVLVGGCCGTTPAHIRAVRKVVDA